MEYRKIEGFDKYFISEKGDVVSMYKTKPRIIATRIKRGYKIVSINNNLGERKNIAVHQLVAIAFLNHIRSGMDLIVHHIDNDKLNNHYLNLKITTQRENSYSHKKPKSGLRGAYKGRSGWFSSILIDGKQTRLGTFKTKEEAHEAYLNKLNDINGKATDGK